RFPAFSGSHGWQWFREIYLNNSTVWTYDWPANTWRDLRPVPEPRVGPLRCAAWDSDHEVIVVFGGEGIQEGPLVYDPYINTRTPTPGHAVTRRSNPPSAVPATWPTTPPASYTSCSARSSRTIRTPGPTTCAPIGGTT